METIDRIEVPGYSGRGLRVQEKSIIRITDLAGCQVGDLFALRKMTTLNICVQVELVK
jgi:uncharacterized protein YcgI (DUF1989 family)